MDPHPHLCQKPLKNEVNQLDRFILILGDGTKIWSMTSFIDTPIVKLRILTVDVTYLCQTICECSLWYYQQNTDKFHFDFLINTQENLLSDECELPSGNPIIQALNQKLEQKGDKQRFREFQDHNTVDTFVSGLNYIFSNEELKQKFQNGEEITLVRENVPTTIPVQQPKQVSTVKNQQAPKKKSISTSEQKKPKPDKRESQIRSFFGQHFKEKEYKQKKEIIIQAIIKSKTKQQINNALMKSFASEDTGEIYKRLKPLIKDLPGN